MTKADYIHLFKEACGGKCNAEYNPCAYRQAADSLAALKPVAWQVMDKNDALREFSIKDIAQDWIVTELLCGSSIVYWVRPLYALDEANNEDALLP
jgi:hypothetical protein